MSGLFGILDILATGTDLVFEIQESIGRGLHIIDALDIVFNVVLQRDELCCRRLSRLKFGRLGKQRGLEIGELPVCVGDVIQINQVFTNLLDNATKYLDSSRPGTIRVSGKTEDGQAIYCVRDNGIGISKGSENKIFEIFQRLDNSAAPGEGLGLAITHRILDRLSGRIWLQSELGKGSDFYVSLPAGESVRTSP